jgi:trk system potassium uptake protein
MNSVQAGSRERILAFRLSPAQLLILGFAFMITLGSLLLMLPVASSTGEPIRPIDAIFTATSAICVTGLIVLDTPVDFSLFGQTIILILFQIGGLGYMTAATLLLMVLGKRIGLQERMVIQETLSAFSMEGLIRFIIGVVLFSVVLEAIGAVFLILRYREEMETATAIYYGIFHSVSAFNNAGFSLFSNSLIDYRTDPTTNITVMVLIVLGTIGFLVYKDIFNFARKNTYRLALHTKVVLSSTAVLIFVGWASVWLIESQNPNGLQPLGWVDQGVTALFQSVSGRTAGFSSMEVGSLNRATLYLIVILMFIGGSPGSAAGGIKTTTLTILAVAIWATMRGRSDATLFFRRISNDTIAKASFLAAMAMVLVSGSTLLLLYSEEQNMLRTLFEVTSAAGTVGMSTGDGESRSFSALFSDFGKAVIIGTMFLGRIGPLAIGVTALHKRRSARFRFPEEKIMIG